MTEMSQRKKNRFWDYREIDAWTCWCVLC